MNNTKQYYNNKAREYCNSTYQADMTDAIGRFTRYLEPGSAVLDFGCGSGRDTKTLLDMGYNVDAVDGSDEMCKIASTNTGIHVRQMDFMELSDTDKYDGIWACASILHLSIDNLHGLMPKLEDALKSRGIVYASFKYGDFTGERNGRFFTDFNEESFTKFIKQHSSFEQLETWISEDVREGREQERWLNTIMTII